MQKQQCQAQAALVAVERASRGEGIRGEPICTNINNAAPIQGEATIAPRHADVLAALKIRSPRTTPN